VSSFTYGVSPQPVHAPENSNNGSRYWTPRTFAKSTRLRRLTGIVSKNATFFFCSVRSSTGARLMALRWPPPPIGFTGHAETHSPQPVQSSAYTCRVYWAFGRPAALSGAVSNCSGAPSRAVSG